MLENKSLKNGLVPISMLQIFCFLTNPIQDQLFCKHLFVVITCISLDDKAFSATLREAQISILLLGPVKSDDDDDENLLSFCVTARFSIVKWFFRALFEFFDAAIDHKHFNHPYTRTLHCRRTQHSQVWTYVGI